MAKHKTTEKPEDSAAPPAEKLSPAREPGDEQAAELSPPREPGDEPPEAAKRPFQPVRGWTSRLQGPLKYRKFTDADLKIIAFQFRLGADEKLPEEALAVMHAHKRDGHGNPTGLTYQNTRKHGKIWSVPNDTEGRTLADRIDFRLSELAQKMEEGQERSPF